MPFNDRLAIVTGAGSPRGIGRAVALCLAARGVNVVIADVNLPGAKNVAKEIVALGQYALAHQVDVSNYDSVQNLVQTIMQKFNRIDILVNNAGITQPIKVINTKEEDFDRVISVNLKGTFFCSQAVLKSMIERRYGRIVNVSSVSGKRGGGIYGGAHYSASKAGILGFSKALAREVVEYGITVNSVCPGLVDTDITVGLTAEQKQAIAETIPMKRLSTAMDVAETVTFLASDEASYITGEDIDINGGLHMD